MDAIQGRLGRYEIRGKIGAGGMGDVYRARDMHLDRDVAIKVLPPRFAKDDSAMARFQREARAVAAISHPNIRAIYDIGCDQGVTYAVMELLEGATLGVRLRADALEWADAVAIGIALADGLAAAHSKGVVHRDIKPDNIFLTSDGQVKILDFGLARVEVTPMSSSVDEIPVTVAQHTHPGMVLGTVAYMSPDQIRGQPADPRSDVFACGCVLYEMTSGRQAFAADTNVDTMAAILHEPAPVIIESSDPRRPAELNRVIARCLEKKAERRFGSARELATALRALVSDLAIPAALGIDSGARSTRGSDVAPATGSGARPASGSGARPASGSGARPASGSGARASADTALRQETAAGWLSPAAADSVAVLPFVNLSSDKENEYFSDGLAEDLIAALTKFEGLQVASRTSSFAFRGKNDDIRKIGEQLNVRRVLEGSVRKSGNRLRITAQLVNVEDGYQLWSETFNRQLEDVFEIQDEISQNISKALRLILSKPQQGAGIAEPTDNVEAYDHYLRGRRYFHQFRRQGYEFAVQMFHRAIELDSNYARAYAGVADCHSLLYTYWETTPEHLKAADEASRKAIALAPNQAEARVSRGLCESLSKHYGAAEQEYETAIQLDPTLFEAQYFYGRMCLAQGKLSEAAEHFEAACRLRPDDYQAPGHLGSIYAGLGRTADSVAACEFSLKVFEKHLALNPDDARALYLGAVTLCQLGRTEQGLQWASRALAIDPHEPVTLYNVACTYSLQNKIDAALDCLEMAIVNGFSHREWIEHDSDLAPLRSSSRYQELVHRLK